MSNFTASNSNSWYNKDEHFMILCVVAAKRSKDPCTKVGACIVDSKNDLLGLGYNGMPRGVNDALVPWSKGSPNPLENKFMYVCHAELNAIANCNTNNMSGCKMYVTLFPCNECAKLIIQHGITEVIYLSDKNSHKPSTIASKNMFNMANVKWRRFSFSKKIVFNLDGDRSAYYNDTIQCDENLLRSESPIIAEDESKISSNCCIIS